MERRKIAPKWTDPSNDNVKRSKKHEFRIAKEFGGQREPRSGGLAWGTAWKDAGTKGRDITAPDFLIEHKNTQAKTMTLKREWLDRIKEVAKSTFKDPMVIVTFQEGDEQPDDWCMVPMPVFKRYLAQYNLDSLDHNDDNSNSE